MFASAGQVVGPPLTRRGAAERSGGQADCSDFGIEVGPHNAGTRTTQQNVRVPYLAERRCQLHRLPFAFAWQEVLRTLPAELVAEALLCCFRSLFVFFPLLSYKYLARAMKFKGAQPLCFCQTPRL